MTILEAEELCKSLLDSIDKALGSAGGDDLSSLLSTLDAKISTYYELKAKLISAYANTRLPSGALLSEAICTVDSLNHRISVLRGLLFGMDYSGKLFSSIVSFIKEYEELKDSLKAEIRAVSGATQLN